MCYYTRFDISYNEEVIADTIKEECGGSWDCYELNAKWYNWQEDIKEVSKKFPDKVIKIEGEGEDSVDIWKAYAKNGKLQVCCAQLTFEEYDEAKLS